MDHHNEPSDNAPPWNLSNKLFGRTTEIREIDNILLKEEEQQQEEEARSVIAVRGVAGSGKSTLIRCYPWKEKGWLLASGKSEKHQTSEPYSVVTEAVNFLLDQCWSLNDDFGTAGVNDSKMEEFRAVLTKDAKLLKKVLPKAFQLAQLCDLETTKEETHRSSLGSEVFTVSHSDAVIAAFCHVISFLCSIRRVILFIDDIQWSDPASLELLQTLMSFESARGVKVVVAYREEKVDSKHAVTSLLENIETDGVPVHHIYIGSLNADGVNDLIAGVTQRKPAETRPLAQVVHQKTQGNPFYVLQLLRLLREEKLLTFSFLKFQWEWGDIGQLQSLVDVSDNVADVVVATMQRLPEATQMALKVASCLGKVLPVDVLCYYFGRSFDDKGNSGLAYSPSLHKVKKEDLHHVLDYAVESGVLTIKRHEHDAKYYWAHDKLQSFAYSLIPTTMRSTLHLRLGMLLKDMLPMDREKEWIVFATADQLNRFSKLEGNHSLGVDVALLNLAAAKLLLDRSGIFSAMGMLEAGARSLDKKSRWTEHYDLSLELFSWIAQVGVQIGKHEIVAEAIQEIDSNARCTEDKFQAHCAMLTSISSGKNRDYDKGVQKTLEILKMYNEKFPNKPLPGQVFIEEQRLKSRLRGYGPQGLLDLPEMVDSRTIKIVTFLICYLAEFSLFSEKHKHLQQLATIRALNIACKRGVCDVIAHGMILFAGNMKRDDGNQREVFEYGECAITLIDKFPPFLGSLHCLVKISFYFSIFPLVRPLTDSLDGFLDCYRIGLKAGDTDRSISGLVGYSWSYLNTGLPLGPFQRDLVSYGQEAKIFKVAYTLQLLLKVFRQTVLNLQAKRSDNISLLTGAAMDQHKELMKVDGSAATQTRRDINTFRLMLACVYNDWDAVEPMIDTLEEYCLAFDFVIARSYIRATYVGLAAFAVSRSSGKKKYRSLGKKMLKFFQTEVQNGAVNAYPILRMLEAEESPSKEKYEEAIKTCARLGLMQHEAYMRERASAFFLLRPNFDEVLSQLHLKRAVLLYKDWGAMGKVQSILQEYDDLFSSSKTFASLDISKNTAFKGRSRYSKHDSALAKREDWSSILSMAGTKNNVSTTQL